MKKITLLFSLMTIALASTVIAGTSLDKNPIGKNPVSESAKEGSVFDKIWDLPTLYKNKDNPYFQEFRLSGQYHTQYTYTDADEDNFDDWETRRLRIGFKAKFLKKLELSLNWNIRGVDDEDFDPEFDSINTVNLTWKPSDAFALTMGKQKQMILAENRTSSSEVLAFERSIATSSAISFDRPWGVSAAGKVDHFEYYAGVFATENDGEYDEWFSSESELMTIIGIGYDFGGKDKLFSKAVLGAEYAHTEDISRVTTRFSDVISVNFSGKTGNFGLNTDLFGGFDDNKGRDLFGLNFTPYYDITKQLQFVTRYSYVTGDDDTVRLRSRYEGSVTKGAGDEAHSIYAGLNYYIYGHKLKLMSGVEYLTVNDSANNGGEYDGYTLFAGLRMFF